MGSSRKKWSSSLGKDVVFANRWRLEAVEERKQKRRSRTRVIIRMKKDAEVDIENENKIFVWSGSDTFQVKITSEM